MKKIIITIILLSFCVITAKAIEPIRWGVVAGLNRSQTSAGISNIDRTGFHVGGQAELPITAKFYLESRLLFSQRGYKSDNIAIMEGSELTTLYTNNKSYYLELPIHAGYKFGVTNHLSIFVSGGGYLALGLFGETEKKYKEERATVDMYENGSGDKRFDCGIGLKAGVEIIQKIQLSAEYDWGLIDTNEYSFRGCKNRTLKFSCAYLF